METHFERKKNILTRPSLVSARIESTEILLFSSAISNLSSWVNFYQRELNIIFDCSAGYFGPFAPILVNLGFMRSLVNLSTKFYHKMFFSWWTEKLLDKKIDETLLSISEDRKQRNFSLFTRFSNICEKILIIIN